MKPYVLLVALMSFIFVGCNVTMSSFWYRDTPDGTQGGYSTYNPKKIQEYNFKWRHSQKQDLGIRRYSVHEITKQTDGTYLVFGLDRDYLDWYYKTMAKGELDSFLKYETLDREYLKHGW